MTKKPVIDHWWQTETGWSIAGNFPQFGLFKIMYGSTGKAAPGFQVNVLNDDGKELAPENMGNLVIKLPLPQVVVQKFGIIKIDFMKHI